MADDETILFNLKITPEDYLIYYQGTANTVSTRSVDGRVVRFPAGILRPFVTQKGISGLFAVQIDARGKFKKITRLAD